MLKTFRSFALLLPVLLGCSPSSGEEVSTASQNTENRPELDPAELKSITAPSYKSSPGEKQECLGRVVFDVGGSVEWPTYYDGNSPNLFARSFSANVFHSSDFMRFGNVQIAVFGPLTSETRDEVRSSLPSVEIPRLEKSISDARARIATLKRAGRLTSSQEWEMTQDETMIENRTAKIEEIRKQYIPFASGGLPDSEGYGYTEAGGGSQEPNYSVFRSYVTRGKYIYIFETHKAFKIASDYDTHAKEFAAVLARFKPRGPNEIPTALGICIPFGFISDDGKTTSDLRQSFRFPDALGVLYTVHVGSHQYMKTVVPLLEATSFASVGNMGTEEDVKVKPFITQRINPKKASIGEMTAIQGGVAAKIKLPGGTPYETYQVFTGYSGRPNIEELPYIFVELNTTTMSMAAELKSNPPAFEQSKGRLDVLLKSMRLRPTTPAMPALVNANRK
jgi:hypothetical protein